MSFPPLKDVVKAFFFSNIFIGICAFANVKANRMAFEGSTQIDHTYEWFVMVATVALYAWHRYLGSYREILDQVNSERHSFNNEYRSAILWIAIGATFLSGLLLTQFEWMTIFQLLPAVLVSALYILPIGHSKQRLRDRAYIKIFLIAFTWTYLCAYLPLGLQLDSLGSVLFLSERLLFLLAITLPFDIRDFYVDRTAGTRTFAHSLGVRRTRMTSIVFLITGSAILIILNYNTAISAAYVLGTFLTYVITLVLISKSSTTKTDLYYTGWVDGTMVIQWISISAATFLIA